MVGAASEIGAGSVGAGPPDLQAMPCASSSPIKRAFSLRSRSSSEGLVLAMTCDHSVETNAQHPQQRSLQFCQFVPAEGGKGAIPQAGAI